MSFTEISQSNADAQLGVTFASTSHQEWTQASMATTHTMPFAAGELTGAPLFAPPGGSGEGTITTPPNPTDFPDNPLPVGDAILPMLICACIYALVIHRRKSRKTI